MVGWASENVEERNLEGQKPGGREGTEQEDGALRTGGRRGRKGSAGVQAARVGVVETEELGTRPVWLPRPCSQ